MTRIRDIAWLVRHPKLSYQWIRQWKSYPICSWLKGAKHFINKDFRNAAKCYKTGLKKHSDHLAATCAELDLAYSLYRLGEFSPALYHSKALCLKGVQVRDCYLLTAKIHCILGQYKSAIFALNTGLRYLPRDIKMLSQLINISLRYDVFSEKVEGFVDTLREIRRGLELSNKNLVHIDTAIAHYFIATDNCEDGEKLLARVLATGEAPYEATLLKVEQLLKNNQIFAVKDQLSRAMKMSPRDPYPVLKLAELYLKSNEESESAWAEQLATLACKLSKWQNSLALKTLSLTCVHKADYSTAELIERRSHSLGTDIQIVNLSSEVPKNQSILISTNNKPTLQ